MFDKFCDYMYYLLTSPFKRIKKEMNQWYILFKVLGIRYDDAMESIYNAMEQTMLATCDPVMLPVHAEDRKMERYPGENDDNFRKRIANYPEVLRQGGSDPGVLLAVKTLGYNNVSIQTAKELKGDASRWAEFYVIVYLEADDKIPIDYSILRKQVRKTKVVGALDNYQFVIQNKDIIGEFADIGRCVIRIKFIIGRHPADRYICRLKNRNIIENKLVMKIKNDLWYWDGKYRFDGTKKFDAYEKEEEL